MDTSGLTPVNPSRFQVLDVDERGDIRSFVQRNGLLFKPGRGFYEFTKPEKVCVGVIYYGNLLPALPAIAMRVKGHAYVIE